MRPTRHLSLAGLAAAAMLSLAACSSGGAGAASPAASAGGPSAAASESAASAAPAASASTGGSSSSVTIADFSFTPGTITVKPGTKVTWMNTGVTHTVTADDGKAFDSGDIAGGASFSFTFATAGTFAYHCQIHHSMTGKVIVAP